MSHVLVVGGTRGIGKAIADRLADADLPTGYYDKVTVIGRTHPTNPVDITIPDALDEALNGVEKPVNGVVFVPRGPVVPIISACYEVCRWACLEMIPMVVVNSVASTGASVSQAVEYHVLKAAQAATVRWFSQAEPGQRINGVCPGRIRADGSGDCTPVEVADVIGFLLSPASAAITGQHIVLDRGRSLRLP